MKQPSKMSPAWRSCRTLPPIQVSGSLQMPLQSVERPLNTCSQPPSRGAGAAQAIVLYAPEEGWALPTVVTLAGVHKAVPVPVTATARAADTLHSSALSALPLAFDARGRWADAENATAWAWSNLYPACQETASLIVLQARLHPHARADVAQLYLAYASGILNSSVHGDVHHSQSHLLCCMHAHLAPYP